MPNRAAPGDVRPRVPRIVYSLSYRWDRGVFGAGDRMSLKRKLRTFLALDRGAKRLLSEALFLRIVIPAGFRLLGVARTQALLRHWAGRRKSAQPVDAQSGIRASRGALRIAKRTLGLEDSCLVRSLALWALLLRRGLDTELRVGFRRQPEGVAGHAWIEYKGVAINEDESVTRTYSVYEGPVSFDILRMIRQNPIRPSQL